MSARFSWFQLTILLRHSRRSAWLRHVAPVGCLAATFDTRIEKPVVLVGSAARGIAKRLEHHGFDLFAPAESFFALDTAGPLKDGEIERAGVRATNLAAQAVTEQRVRLAGAGEFALRGE